VDFTHIMFGSTATVVIARLKTCIAPFLVKRELCILFYFLIYWMNFAGVYRSNCWITCVSLI
jgi:hypothetical protein